MEQSGNGASEMETRRTLFVCGYIDKRWHNSSLNAITTDLMAQFFVCANATKSTPWTSLATKYMLARTELALFFINEFTLSDVRCLLTLQFAWELHLPILMIRPPRTKLVICEGATSKTVTPKSTDMGFLVNMDKKISPPQPPGPNPNPLRPDYDLLQEILYHGYQNSLSYDRLDHLTSMARLKNRIARLLAPLPGANDSESLASLSVSNNATPSPQPPKGRPPHGGSGGAKRAQRSPCMPQKDVSASSMRATKSMVNLSNGGSSRMPPANGVADLLPQVNRQLSQKSTASSRSERRSSVSSLDDVSNYTATQYLVFSVKDRTQNPMLIQFPNDVIFDYESGRFQNPDAAEYLEKDVWGSDTSLEEEAEIAPSILGRFEERDLTAHIATHEPDSDLDDELAPYIKPI
ncbi:hypothetical protein QR680_012017 [Steinernema hermaphroditum]|uniref:Uncharacterized protein n=1 Tax=Steinernema hermaphroditum TaxID=289476 RepID=A0AA39LZS9_9BILA|nr:hypothetical protein QR680_012017 [Steinernema hermaphroditum]